MRYVWDTLPLERLLGPVAHATAALVRLDERLARSPVRAGLAERQNFSDAAAALWLEGELVHTEDLVLHDARMDIRTPTHALTRAHAVLRARRLICARAPGWAFAPEGLRALSGRAAFLDTDQGGRAGKGAGRHHIAGKGSAAGDRDAAGSGEGGFAGADADALEEPAEADLLAQELAAIDAVLERTARVLEGGNVSARKEETSRRDRRDQPSRSDLIYDPDWDEQERLAEWQAVVAGTAGLPAALRAAILLDAWQDIAVLQHAPWLGPLLTAALLRQEGLTQNHLACFNLGAQKIPRERRRARSRTDRVMAFLDALGEAARAGLKEHDRLVLAKSQMERRLASRRASSKLPQLIELVLAKPLVSTTMIQAALKVSRQGALNLVAELNLREMTGRKRFQAWGVI